MDLQEHTIASSTGEYSRKAWYLPGTSQVRKIGIFLDGEYYVNHMDAPAMLHDLQAKGAIPDMACLFVSHVNGEARHHDFTCNERYARFLAEDLVAWVQSRHEGLPSSNHFIGGTSLSGLQATYTSILHPQIFSSTLCQSGSFWWNQEWLHGHLRSLFTSGGKFWLSVGDKETDSGAAHPPTGLLQEIDQISASERFVEALRELDVPVHYHLYQGGHEIRPWKEEFPAAVSWLLDESAVA